MSKIIVGEKVVNKIGEHGVIISCDDSFIHVEFKNRIAKLQITAFEQGFLKYENENFQQDINEEIQRKKQEQEQAAEKIRLASENAKNLREAMEAQAPVGVRFNSVSVRLEPSPATISSVKGKHKNLVKEIFEECDNDISEYYSLFNPKMKYLVPADYRSRPSLRSRYCVGFLSKYKDVYVLRVLSRNDVYTPGVVGGCIVTNSDTTEIIRILSIDGEFYCFSKHLSCEGNNYKNSKLHKKWQSSNFVAFVQLDEIIKRCDCGYINDCVEEKDVNCLQYAKLLFGALNNNKAEIVFKHKMFKDTSGIDNIVEYLESFSTKQIDFACKHNALNTLPFIKKYGLYEADVLSKLEQIVIRKKRDSSSVYDYLIQAFNRFSFDISLLDKKLIGFLKKIEFLRVRVYLDYITLLCRRRETTIDDFFDKDYEQRHFVLLQEQYIYYSKETSEKYIQIAKELSWIDREKDGYFIIVPKTIPEFKHEGEVQHNCVYTLQYFNYVIKRRSIIVFLRKEKNTPFVTIEFDYESFEILQAYGKYNSSIDKELNTFIEELAKELHQEMISHE